MQRPKLFFPSTVWPLILWLVFAGVYAGIFFMQRSTFIEQYHYTVSRIPSVMLYGSDMAKMLEGYGSTYGGFVGIAIGFVYLVLAYVLLGIFALVRLTRRTFGSMLAFLIGFIPVGVVAYFIQYQPRPRTAISSALANFVGIPLWYTALFIAGLLILLFVLSLVYGKQTPSSEERS